MANWNKLPTIEHGPYADMFATAFEKLMDSGASDAVLAAAERAYGETRVEMSSRMTRAAGYAKWKSDPSGVSNLKIQFSGKIFPRMNDDEKFNTVSHEFAHIVDVCLRGYSKHDMVWRSLHIAMGGNGKRCHNYDVSGLGRAVKRMVVQDNRRGQGGVERRITANNWNKVKSNPQLVLVAEEQYRGKELLSRKEVRQKSNDNPLVQLFGWE